VVVFQVCMLLFRGACTSRYRF